MLRARFAMVPIVFVVGVAFCQQSSQSAQSLVCSFSEIYKKDGWTVPGIKGAQVMSQRAALQNLPGVFVTMLRPINPETDIQKISCPYDHPGRLVVEEVPIKILDLWSFDFGGRVFAYRISYAREAVNNGVRSELAAASTIFFYDLDGSGRFTIVRDAKMGIGSYAPGFIPDWASRSANQTSVH